MRVYRPAALCVTLLAFQSLLPGVTNAAALTNMEWNVEGTPRRALVQLPASTNGAPIIFAFHGHGGTMNFAARKFRLHELWPEAVVVYPQGLPTRTPRDLEGMRAGVDYLRTQNPWDSQDRTPQLTKILVSYGAHAKTVVPDLKRIADTFAAGEPDFPKNLSLQKAAAVREAIRQIEASTDHPKLIRLK